MDDTVPTSGYVSILSVNWLRSIERLWSGLLDFQPKPPNQVQTSPIENGLSIGLILISIVMTESVIHRTYYLLKEWNRLEKAEKQFRVLRFFKDQFSSSELAQDLEELLVIRDILAHNHVWEANIAHRDSGLEIVDDYIRTSGGDNKYFNCVDFDTRLTKRLTVNIVPTKIWREDVRKVVIGCYTILKYLEDQDRSFSYLSIQPLWIGNKAVRFCDFVDELRSTSYSVQ